MGRLLRAALWIPRGLDPCRWLDEEAELARAHGWRSQSYVRDWPELMRLLGCGHLEIGIIPSWAHLPLGEVPRLVALDDELPPPSARQRPRWLR